MSKLYALMLYVLKRHPVPVSAWFEHCLVLAYAYPVEVLRPLLPPGLTVDEWNGLGFVAVAMVQTRGLRPSRMPPAMGMDFFLTGYRVFAKFRPPTPTGRTLRGLRILRSDANRRAMVLGGNMLTHYHYRLCTSTVRRDGEVLAVDVRTPRGDADVSVRADLRPDAPLPEGSPFKDWKEARRFAGPLPYTFDYERQTHSIVCIKGVREHWDPAPVRVQVGEMRFLQTPALAGHQGRLASAFYASAIDYRWERGVRMALAGAAS